MFASFIIGGYSFVWRLDGMNQHVKALGYYGMYLRDIAAALFAGQGFYAPGFSFSIGYGSDILDTLNYYAIGDPLNLFAAFVPQEATPTLYTTLVVVRFYLAGLAFALYANYVFRPNRTGLLASALMFAFCGFSLYAGVRHPYFMNPLIYLPLVLYGVEKVLRERKHVPFALAIALSAASNFYFFYMIFLVMALYILMRLAALHYRKGLRTGLARAAKDFLHLVGAGVIGVLAACIVFVPVVMFFMQDSRQAIEYSLPLLFDDRYYSKLLLNVSTVNQPGNWTFTSIGIMGVAGIVSLFTAHGNRQLKVGLVALAVMLCFPVFGYVFNGTSYVANRWCWAFCFAAACVLAVRWDDLCSMTRKRALLLAAIVAAYLAVCLVLNWGYMHHKIFAAEVAFWFVSVACIAAIAVWNNGSRAERSARYANGAIAIVVCAGIALNGFMLYSETGDDYASSFVSWQDAGELYGSEAKVVNDQDEQTGFYRYSGAPSLMSRNAGMMYGLSSTTNYWSLVNGCTKDFFTEMGINGSDGGGFSWYDLNGQSVLYELLGVKYYLAEPGGLLPYGYSGAPLTSGSYYDPRDCVDKEYALFENTEPLPFGFTYARAISPEAFDALEPERRRELVLQACAIGEGSAAVREVSLSDGEDIPTSAQAVPYRIEALDGAEVRDGTIVAQKDGATVRIVVDSAQGSEMSLQITNLVIDAAATNVVLGCAFEYADGSVHYCNLPVTMPGNQAYEPYRWFTVCPGYSATELKSIIVAFDEAGTYSYDDLRVIAQPMGAYNAWVSALTENVMENIDLHYLSAETAATNRVTGEVNLDQPKILCTQIPYSQGWSVRVDGEPADLLQANVMLCAVELPAGHHTVEFAYETPGLSIGALLTLLGLAGLIALVFLDRRLRVG